MALRLHIFVLCVFGLFGLAALDDPKFPNLKSLEIAAHTTEVQVTDIEQQDSAYATEYYDYLSDAGKLEILAAGERITVFYYNETNELFQVNETTCLVEDADLSDFYFYGAFFGWLNREPLVIGPSAPLFYAQTRMKDIKYAGKEYARDIECEKFTLTIDEPAQYIVLEYYFAPADWTTPYQYKGLRVPIRIHAFGNTSADSQKADRLVPVDIYTDFAYFKPSIEYNDLQPPTGLGCYGRTLSNTFPDIPKSYQYSAEVVDLLYESENDDVDVRFERVWYDKKQKIARLDIYKKTTSSSSFQDFNTGVMYEFTKERKCHAEPLKNSFFDKYEADMVAEMKDEKEVLNLDGDFYKMGQKNMRGIICDVYEKVEKDVFFKAQQLDRLVVTAYFTEDYMLIGINGEDEIRVPVIIQLTGWKNATKKAFQLQYNIFNFNDNIWPEMYDNFRMEDCYIKQESKTYFVMMIEARPEDAAAMESQNELVVKELRGAIVRFAEVPDWRVPFLKVDYKMTGVFAQGLMVERPPELLQFYEFDTKEQVAWKKEIEMVVDAYTLEDCAKACIDFDDFPCKGFYFCNSACIVKSTDPSEKDHIAGDEEVKVGLCSQYLRAVKFTSNLHNSPLKEGLRKLENAVLNQTIDVVFKIKNGMEDIKVADIVIGEGPYTGVDAADKPYKINDQFRKLDPGAVTSKAEKGVEMLHDCYQKCKAAGSECSSFSFCGRSDKKERECIISSEIIVRGKTNDLDLIASPDCDIYDLNYLQYFIQYPEHVSFLNGYEVIDSVTSAEECAKQCRLADKGKCRGFEYCSPLKKCSLHTKHILDLGEGEKGSNSKPNECIHYAARFIADYDNLGYALLDDDSHIRYSISLEECARVCSEELGDGCRSFNYCPTGKSSCALSGKILTDSGITTTEKDQCVHYEKRANIKDWSNTKAKDLSKTGWTKKGFTGLVVGMLALGLIIGVLGFIGYSYIRSRRSGDGLTVRFSKQDI